MFKYIAMVLIVGGLAILFTGGFQWMESKASEEKRLEEAETIIQESKKEPQEESFNYDHIQKGDTVGVFYIPELERELPIIEGTDEEELAEGVGHFEHTGFPGEGKQILLSGHRDSVFRNFGELEPGDEFHIKMENGTFVYEIIDHEIVDAYDESVINTEKEQEYLTVSTCYPFSFIGDAPDRYVLYALPK